MYSKNQKHHQKKDEINVGKVSFWTLKNWRFLAICTERTCGVLAILQFTLLEK